MPQNVMKQIKQAALKSGFTIEEPDCMELECEKQSHGFLCGQSLMDMHKTIRIGKPNKEVPLNEKSLERFIKTVQKLAFRFKDAKGPVRIVGPGCKYFLNGNEAQLGQMALLIKEPTR